MLTKVLQAHGVHLMNCGAKEATESGNKIMLPPSILETLAAGTIESPMLFQLRNKVNNNVTNCGVLEFSANEGSCFMPFWIMRQLNLFEGDPIEVSYTKLLQGDFARLQPQSTDFLDITNPKAVLENCFRNFACLTTGDIFTVDYNNKKYNLKVTELKPGQAVCVIDCDLTVEFDPPLGFKKSERKSEWEDFEDNFEDDEFGLPRVKAKKRIDVFTMGNADKEGFMKISNKENPKGGVKGVPDKDWRFGELKFMRIRK